jgi:hypothetical protein
MPIIPPANAAPYDTAEYVLNLARAIANDAAESGADVIFYRCIGN